jgi:hypothetical protein
VVKYALITQNPMVPPANWLIHHDYMPLAGSTAYPLKTELKTLTSGFVTITMPVENEPFIKD